MEQTSHLALFHVGYGQMRSVCAVCSLRNFSKLEQSKALIVRLFLDRSEQNDFMSQLRKKNKKVALSYKIYIYSKSSYTFT